MIFSIEFFDWVIDYKKCKFLKDYKCQQNLDWLGKRVLLWINLITMPDTKERLQGSKSTLLVR